MPNTIDIAGLCIGGGVVLLLFVLSVVLLCGKGAFLIAGYNTMSLEEKRRWNAKALCRAVGAMALLLSLGIGAALVLFAFGREALGVPFIHVPVLLVIPFAVWVNVSKRFKAGG